MGPGGRYWRRDDKKLLNNSINAARLWRTDLNKLSFPRLVYTMAVSCSGQGRQKAAFQRCDDRPPFPQTFKNWGNIRWTLTPPLF